MNCLVSQRRRRRGLPLLVLPALILVCAGWFAAAAAQNAPSPRREQLLNGLRILLLNRPGDQNVLLKLRVHSGSAFDLAGKEGLMAALADAMFDAQTREYVTEELGGRIEVTTGYDSIDVTLAGRATDFDRLLELARNAVTNIQLTPEAVERVRSARLKSLPASPSAAETADRAVASRLFGPHPYGRLTAGTPESVARIERTDLMLVRERFLNPNNTSLVIVGGFDARGVMRTLRASLGGWRKSDGKVPATFRLPDSPDERALVINRPGAGVEVRVAVRGLARTDRDAPVARLAAEVVRERWLSAFPELKGAGASVTNHSFHAGGVLRMSASVGSAADAARAVESARAVMKELASTPPTADELRRASGALAAAQPAGASPDEQWADRWLDEHTYQVGADSALDASKVSPAEFQRVAARLFLHTPVAAVAVGDAAQLRAELARVGAVEVFGEAASKPEPPPATKPQQPAIQLKRP